MTIPVYLIFRLRSGISLQNLELVGFMGDNYLYIQSIYLMSDNIYLKLRKSAHQNQRKGAFPFPSYAEALFSQVLVSRTAISSSFERPAVRTPVASFGPEVATDPAQGSQVSTDGDASQSISEKKKILQSFDQFIDQEAKDSGSKKVSFPGGEVAIKEGKVTFSDGAIIELATLEERAGDRPVIYDYEAFESDELSILFVGERPKDFDDERPRADLLSKMIGAMKLQELEFSRVFLSKDAEMAQAEWYRILQLLDGRMQLCIVPLGAKACNTVLGTKERLSKIHGQEFKFRLLGKKTQIDLSVFPVFHPDFLQINPNMKRSAWIDLQKVMTHLGIN